MARESFHRDLQRLQDEVLLLGSMVESMLTDAVDVLKRRDIDLAAAREICDRHGALLVDRRGPDRHGPHRRLVRPPGRRRRPPTSSPSPRASATASRSAPASPRRRPATLLGPGSHGSTFGGNPVAAIAGLAVLRSDRARRAAGPRHGDGRAPARLDRGAGPPAGRRRPRPRPAARLVLTEPVAAQVAAAALDAGFMVNAPRPTCSGSRRRCRHRRRARHLRGRPARPRWTPADARSAAMTAVTGTSCATTTSARPSRPRSSTSPTRSKADPFALPAARGPASVAVLFDKPTLRTQVSFAPGIAELGGFPMIIDGRLAAIGQRRVGRRHRPGARPAGRGHRLADVRPGPARGDGRARRRAGGQRADRRLPPLPDPRRPADHPRAARPDWPASRWPTSATAPTTWPTPTCSAARLAGLHVRIGAPTGFQPDPAILARAAAIAARTGGSVAVTDSAAEAVAGADVRGHRHLGLDGPGGPTSRTGGGSSRPYALTAELLAHAAPDAIVLHCLPAYRGKEIAAEVHRRPAVGGLGRGGEPPARAEGGAGLPARAGRRLVR